MSSKNHQNSDYGGNRLALLICCARRYRFLGVGLVQNTEAPNYARFCESNLFVLGQKLQTEKQVENHTAEHDDDPIELRIFLSSSFALHFSRSAEEISRDHLSQEPMQ